MSNTSLLVSAQGSTAVDGFTESTNGDFRQAIVIADQSNNAGVATVTSADSGVATSEYGMVVRPIITDAAKLRTSAILDSGSVSAKSSDAGTLLVSAKQGDAGLLRVSSLWAQRLDAGNDSVSAIQGDAGKLLVSAKQGDAALLRASALLGVDITGALTIGRLSNLSSSGNVKATAGVVYGYYAYNTDTKYNYINLTNTSGAINVGTDAVILKIALPPSAAAHVEYPRGLKGFTAGIGAYATSAIADSATTPSPTSAIGINILYN